MFLRLGAASCCRDLFDLKSKAWKSAGVRPFILSPNHQSYLDAPVVIACLPWQIMRDTFYVGTSEIFGSAIMRRIAESVRIIVIDPDANLVPAMRAGAYGLRKPACWFCFPKANAASTARPSCSRKARPFWQFTPNAPSYRSRWKAFTKPGRAARNSAAFPN